VKTRSYKVLVADSNPLDRSTICDSLKEQGYTVIEAEGGRQAMEMLHRRQSVDAVLITWPR
jgi:CheY-like chemotaxis protein